MFGLVCTGLDELLDGVASLEDYLCQSIPCYLTRSSWLVWCVQGWTSCWTGLPHWRIISPSALLVIKRDLHVWFGMHRARRAA
jgi:hypothetical protein